MNTARLLTKDAGKAVALYAADARLSLLKVDCETVTERQLAQLRSLFAASGSRSCDFTVGGLLFWTGYFRYRTAVSANTLFVRGLSEDNAAVAAFWPPIGEMPVEDSVAVLKDYCRSRGIEPRLTAVPEDMIDRFRAMDGVEITELYDFADYVYDIEALATLSGKKLGKKRNHVNRFMVENPDYSFEPITPANLAEVMKFYDSVELKSNSPSALYESMMTRSALQRFMALGMSGALLRAPERGIVAFTIGEVQGDTLHVHIEKMLHDVEGAGETINKLFAAEMLASNPELRYVNRQDDAGDPGLRKAKESYHPAFMIRKYNVVLPR